MMVSTHNGVFDIAYLRNLPEIVLMAPKDGNELKSMLKIALESGKAVAIRYPKEDIPDKEMSPQYKTFEIGKAEVLREEQTAFSLLTAPWCIDVCMRRKSWSEKRYRSYGGECAVCQNHLIKRLFWIWSGIIN